MSLSTRSACEIVQVCSINGISVETGNNHTDINNSALKCHKWSSPPQNRQSKYIFGIKLQSSVIAVMSSSNVSSWPLTATASPSWSIQRGDHPQKRPTCCCFSYMLLFIRAQQVQASHQSHHNHVRALLPAVPFPPVSPTLASECLSALNSLRVSSVSPALLSQGCDLSAKRALNNREGRNKRNKQHQPSVFQQLREDAGITMPEPVPKGMQILSMKA